MSRSAWAEDTGVLPGVIVSACAAGEPGNRVYLAVRDSLYLAVKEMFADPMCNAATKDLVRRFLTGSPDASG